MKIIYLLLISFVLSYCKKGDIDYFAEKNIIKFFKKAKEYSHIPVAQYCTYPCRITGKVKLDFRFYFS